MPGAITRATWTTNVGLTLNLTEGNSSTRLLGAALNSNREGPKNFVTLNGSAQYGLSRVPSRLPVRGGATPQERAGTPGRWAFDENINNWLGQAKLGQYFTPGQTDYVFSLGRAEGNHFAGYWERYEVQFGYGRRIANDQGFVRLEVGPDFTEDHLVVNRVRSRVAAAAGLSASLTLTPTATVTEDLAHLRTLKSNDTADPKWRDYRTRSTTSIVLQVTNRLSFQSALQVDHASRPAPGAHPLDVKVTNALLLTL